MDAVGRMANHRYQKWLRWLEQLGIYDISQADQEIWNLLLELADLRSSCFVLELASQIESQILSKYPDCKWRDLH